MNLNSYIALMDRHLAVRRAGPSLELPDAPSRLADLAVPDADDILTLDADSVLEPSYATRLIHSCSARRMHALP
jgi:hypothetical protein